jgi:LytS/YehU family sensor histidine kinase
MVALNARINPHFLFNVLGTISNIILRHPEEAVQAVSKLSKLYRYLLESSDQDMVTLEREIEHVNVYLSIQKLRFGSRLEYSIGIGHGLEGILLPTLSIQPLVENAVKYGIEPENGGGKVWVEAREEGGECRISVRDDGGGWSEANPGTGEGLKNIRERLKLAYGDRARINIGSSRGYEIIVWVPCPKIMLGALSG